ncbi:TPA: hypothetical protein L4Q94_005710 [Pseudomonas aeruginosa]|nr:hypothetical protein [Pseudomonas aeruginosa]HBO3065492.1 hypothetical protein [Pseudomonas aeruginosa]HBO3077352.1 hypothetical protein [Pseudomonas aeruginosa]
MASRNRKEMNKRLFERILHCGQQRGAQIENIEKVRYIQRLNESDASLMSSADAEVLNISRHTKLIKIAKGDDCFFCTIGISEPGLLPTGLEPAPITPALFAITVLEAEVQPSSSVTGYKIKDAIEGEYQGVQDYDGHLLEKVTPLFPSIQVYKVSSNEPFLDYDLYRVVGSLLSRSYFDGPIHISCETLEGLREIFETGSKYIPFRNLVQGMMSISWEGLFLEIYRCLEQLYAEPHISALKTNWPSSLPMKELASYLEEHLSWRPREDEALRKIIEACEEELIDNLFEAMKVDNGGKGKKVSSASKAVYALRNGIVHYRPIHNAVEKSDEQWNKIISCLLNVVSHVYDLRGEPFFVGDKKNSVLLDR